MNLTTVLDNDPDRKVGWAPQEGAQQKFLTCPVFEVLLEGNRGGGKTTCLLMDFAQHVGEGFGAKWRGVLFRQTYPQLKDVIAKTLETFPILFPDAKYNRSDHTWSWPTGEELLLRYMNRIEDYGEYHGHEYPWIGFEELTYWSDQAIYKRMMSCCRSATPDIPRKYRATTNPYGKGHTWVRQRFGLPIEADQQIGRIIHETDTTGAELPPRVAIRLQLMENKILLEADPDYVSRIRASARNPSEAAAWIEGSWDIVAGGMFDDLWVPKVHVVGNFPIDQIPKRWRIDRAYDHGQSAPFSVGWYAVSNGEPMQWEGKRIGTKPGDLIRFQEWYGWNGTANEGLRMGAKEIAAGILAREREWGILGRVYPGPADTGIFDDYEPGKSVAGDMSATGVNWEHADKGPGSRKQGWEQMRKLMKAAIPGKDGTRDAAGLFVCYRCAQFLRTVPVLPRSEKDPDDGDTDAEDHAADEVRYRIRRKEREMVVRSF